jgi:hypothetical protein
MSYAVCDKCGERINVFGESHLQSIAEKYDIKHTAQIPINPKLAAACDKGMIELFAGDYLNPIMEEIKKL